MSTKHNVNFSKWQYKKVDCK